jgi:hypothetical protein
MRIETKLVNAYGGGGIVRFCLKGWSKAEGEPQARATEKERQPGVQSCQWTIKLTHPIKEKVTPVDPACPVAPADGTGVTSENGTWVAQVDGTGVQTKQNKCKNL